jgi:hypothetical protein
MERHILCVRGVYFLRSDADSGVVAAAGNLFSNLRFNLATADRNGAIGRAIFSMEPLGMPLLFVNAFPLFLLCEANFIIPFPPAFYRRFERQRHPRHF